MPTQTIPPNTDRITIGRTFEDEGLLDYANPSAALNSAFAARLTARMNASVTVEDRNTLMRERASLLDKKFGGPGLQPADKRRLRRIEWSLDRIADVRYGADFDARERTVQAQRLLANKIEYATEEILGAFEASRRKARDTQKGSRARSGTASRAKRPSKAV